MTPETPSEAAQSLLARVSLAIYAVQDLRRLVDAQERWLQEIQQDLTSQIMMHNYVLTRSLESLDD
jgi:hypothetical protein